MFENAFKSPVIALCFTDDSRHLIVSSADGTLKVFDLLTSSLVDWLQFESPIRSLDFSPTGEYLATSHLNEKGIYLWASKQYFSENLVQRLPKCPVQMRFPKNRFTKAKRDRLDFYKSREETKTEVSVDLLNKQIDDAF